MGTKGNQIMFTVNSITNEVSASRLPESPHPGTVIPYFRDGRRQWGIVWGVQTYEVKRYTIRKERVIVESYIVEPCGESNVQYITVCEDDVDWRSFNHA
jgi:hypothetical protein